MRMPSPVHHSQHDEFVRDRPKVDRIRKPLDERAAGFTVDAGISERVLHDARERPLNRLCEGSSKPGPLFLIPTSGVEQLQLSLRPKNEP